MTLFNDIMPYFDEFIHVYGWNMSILWSPLKIWTPQNCTTANFRHPVSKSWLRHCNGQLKHSLSQPGAKPSKITPYILWRISLNMSIQAYNWKNFTSIQFLCLCIRTLYIISISNYIFMVAMCILWSPLKNMTPKMFEIAAFQKIAIW